MWANAQRDGRPAEIEVAPSVQRCSLADAHYCQDAKPVEITWGAPN